MATSVTRHDYDAFMVPCYNPARFIPVKGIGSRVWDQEGREFIDFTGGIAVESLGHCHPEMIAALQEQAAKVWHLSNYFTNEPALQLARLLVEKTFAERVFFCNSGAEANEAALKLARRYSYDHFGGEKNQIIACTNSFHGRTLFTVTVGGQPKYQEGFGPLPSRIDHIPFNDIVALEAAMSETSCALIIEPIQGEGGVVPADPLFLAKARELCDRWNALLIFDEVQTGIGRTGVLFAYQRYGVVPDILSSAKGLGGGFPIGAMLTRESIAKSFIVGTHGSTYGGNPLACAVAHRVVSIVSSDELLLGVEQRRKLFLERLQTIDAKYNLFATIRGEGLLIGCLLQPRLHGRARDIVQAAEKEQLMMLIAGPNVLRFAPSLIISEEEIAEGLTRLERAIAAVDFILP